MPHPTPCAAEGTHVALPDGQSCGIREWLSCDDCGRYALADPHAACTCGIPANLPQIGE